MRATVTNNAAGASLARNSLRHASIIQTRTKGIEDSRTAERVRETLAAGADYKYDAVKVTASTGVVQLSGFVNTSAQRNTAAAVASNVVGVTRVENNFRLKP